MLRVSLRTTLRQAKHAASRAAVMRMRVPAQGSRPMSSLEGTKTLQNLKEAFAGESLARMRYRYFAQRADIEGYSEVAAAFREIASSEEAQAMGHLEFLQEFGDPVSNQPMGSTQDNLECAIVGETHDGDVLYAEAAKTAKAEGFDDAGHWMETVQQADKLHKKRFEKVRSEL